MTLTKVSFSAFAGKTNAPFLGVVMAFFCYKIYFIFIMNLFPSLGESIDEIEDNVVTFHNLVMKVDSAQIKYLLRDSAGGELLAIKKI